jgi:hypothetical protein
VVLFGDIVYATLSNISAMATSFSGGRSRSPQREPPTMGKQLVNFITYGCELSALFFVIYKARAFNIFQVYQYFTIYRW